MDIYTPTRFKPTFLFELHLKKSKAVSKSNLFLRTLRKCHNYYNDLFQFYEPTNKLYMT